jgi:hypothetical protein
MEKLCVLVKFVLLAAVRFQPNSPGAGDLAVPAGLFANKLGADIDGVVRGWTENSTRGDNALSTLEYTGELIAEWPSVTSE